MTVMYQLKLKKTRNLIDLTIYADNIIYAIQQLFPDAEVNVYPTYFEVTDSAYLLSETYNLQNMGRYISYNCYELRTQVKSYGKSRQLFSRIKN